MRRLRLLFLALAAASAFAIPPGSLAPDFKGTDSNGKTQSLAQYRGKYVVLEWANQGCPYEQKLYHSGTMEKLQKEWTAKGVVWLSVISSAPGQQGYVTAARGKRLPEEDERRTHRRHPRSHRRHRPSLRGQDHAAHVRHRPHRQGRSTRAPSTTSPAPTPPPCPARTTTSPRP